MISSRLYVRRFTSKKTYEGRQELVKEWRLFGFKIWTAVVDSEDLPSWAIIQLGALGYTHWQSKFKDYI